MSANAARAVRRLNRLWLDGEYDELGRLFHRDAVLLTPDGERNIVGRQAIVEGYRQFSVMGKVNDFQIRRVDTFAFNAGVVCHMHFSIDYEIDARRYREDGTEIYFLQRSSAGHRSWKIIWRTQLTASESEVTDDDDTGE